MEKNEGKGKTHAQSPSAATFTCLDALTTLLHACIHKHDAKHDETNRKGRRWFDVISETDICFLQ